VSELIGSERKQALKELIRRAHAGEDVEALKREFAGSLGDLTPVEIAQLEQELIREGISREEIASLCDVHLAVFRESLEEVEPLAPPGHPIHILMEEHRRLLEASEELREAAREYADTGSEEALSRVKQRLDELVEKGGAHYLREENVLFPALERHGIEEPPAVLWMDHDHIRSLEKELRRLVDSGEASRLVQFSRALSDAMMAHFQREAKILYPAALEVIGESEWRSLREAFDEIGGYFRLSPPPWREGTAERAPSAPRQGGEVDLGTGSLSADQLRGMLDALPVDITFVDAADRVKYFNKASDRVFVRSKAIIGRSVQNCHPPKSVHIVNRILEEFKAGIRDQAEFWIQMGDRFVYIRYFPVRGESGEYLGTLEVTQDVSRIRGLSGEKRLLDEPPVQAS
jgi:DUF438 domain-containing protein